MNAFTLPFLYRIALTAITAAIFSFPGDVEASEANAETAYTDTACIECHRTGSEESDLHIPVRMYKASVHADEITCQDCHTGVEDESHQSIEGSGAVDCGACHEQENRHGQHGPTEARPQCHDCHSRHHILTKDDVASAIHPDQLPLTCAECHPVATGKKNFFSWFPAFRLASHNKADFGAAYEKDNCLGCHQGAGAHGEESPINDQNCHTCHVSAGTPGAMWGRMHPQADRHTQPVVFAAASIYQIFIVIGLVLLAARIFKRRQTAPGKKSATAA